MKDRNNIFNNFFEVEYLTDLSQAEKAEKYRELTIKLIKKIINIKNVEWDREILPDLILKNIHKIYANNTFNFDVFYQLLGETIIRIARLEKVLFDKTKETSLKKSTRKLYFENKITKYQYEMISKIIDQRNTIIHNLVGKHEDGQYRERSIEEQMEIVVVMHQMVYEILDLLNPQSSSILNDNQKRSKQGRTLNSLEWVNIF